MTFQFHTSNHKGFDAGGSDDKMLDTDNERVRVRVWDRVRVRVRSFGRYRSRRGGDS